MIKKIIIWLLCSLVSISAYAGGPSIPEPQDVSQSYFNGFNIGGNVARSNGNVDLSTTQARGIIFGPSPHITTESTQNSNADVTGSVFAGFGHNLKRLYFAILAVGYIGDINVSQQNHYAFSGATGFGNSIYKTTICDQFGFNFKPGILITPRTLLFVIFGVGRSKIKFQETDNIGDPTESSILLTITNSVSQHKTALKYGAGIETFIFKRLSVTLQYLYTDFGTIHFSNTAVFNSPPITSETFTSSAKVVEQQASIGLSLYFL